jgi:hypothetical protein
MQPNAGLAVWTQCTDERRQLGITLDAAHALCALQEAQHRLAQRHFGMLVDCHSLAMVTYHRVGRLDNVVVAHTPCQ